MADSNTEFSVVLPLQTKEDQDCALDIYHERSGSVAQDDEDGEGGFNAAAMFGSTDLCIWSAGDGDPEQVVAFVRKCAAALTLTGRWGFQWVSTCSKPRPDGFDSGVIILDLATGETLGSLNAQQWLAEHLLLPSRDVSVGAPVPTTRLTVRPFSDGQGEGFELVQTDCETPITIAIVHDGADRGVGEAEAVARLLSAAPAMAAVLQEALGAWSPQFDGDPQRDVSVSGADLMDWFAQWRLRARNALKS